MQKKEALLIINRLGSTGTPPEIGLEAFTVGLDAYLKTLEEEYLKNLLKTYHFSTFKLVVGNYGGGKTHFLYNVRNLAFQNNFVVAYVALNPTECPFDKLELVYKQIINNLEAPSQKAPRLIPGIEAFIEHWYLQVKEKFNTTEELFEYLNTLRGVESISFLNAVKGAFFNFAQKNLDEFYQLLQYLKGEDVTKDLRARYRISERIDRSTAFRMIRSLIQWINLIGYNGAIFLFDEAERGISMSSSKDKRRALDNLRQIIDECGQSHLPGAMFFYAIPDENLLYEGSGGVYEALRQRLRTVFSNNNPLGVKISLEDLEISPLEFLLELGRRLLEIFKIAYDLKLDPQETSRLISNLAQRAAQAFGYDISYRRLFVVSLIEILLKIKNDEKYLAKLKNQDIDKILRVTGQRLQNQTQQEVTNQEF
jgi:hypothetical protein